MLDVQVRSALTGTPCDTEECPEAATVVVAIRIQPNAKLWRRTCCDTCFDELNSGLLAAVSS